MYRANLTHNGAIHVPHDPLRCSLARRCGSQRLLELGYRTNGGAKVQCEFEEHVAGVRLVRPH